MLYGDLNGKEIQKREDICTRVADSVYYTVETDTVESHIKALKMSFFLNSLKRKIKC